MDRVGEDEVVPVILDHPASWKPRLSCNFFLLIIEIHLLVLSPQKSGLVWNRATNQHCLLMLRWPQMVPAQLALLLEMNRVVVVFCHFSEVQRILAFDGDVHLCVVLACLLNQ